MFNYLIVQYSEYDIFNVLEQENFPNHEEHSANSNRNSAVVQSSITMLGKHTMSGVTDEGLTGTSGLLPLLRASVKLLLTDWCAVGFVSLMLEELIHFLAAG